MPKPVKESSVESVRILSFISLEILFGIIALNYCIPDYWFGLQGKGMWE